MASGFISLRGVTVHNLKQVDLDIPRGKLIVLCGLSGSGKTSLALDTLYAEGQRRYIDSFSAYTRQFLQRLEKPAAERIDGIPPAIAVTHKNTTRSSRSTVGTATETSDYLRLLFARIGHLFCRGCGQEVRRETSQSAGEALGRLPEGRRFMVAFALPPGMIADPKAAAATLREQGFVRLIVGEKVINLSETGLEGFSGSERMLVLVDRLAAGSASPQRLRDSLETTFSKGEGKCHVLIESLAAGSSVVLPLTVDRAEPTPEPAPSAVVQLIDGQLWREQIFSMQLRCEACGLDYPELEPRLFSFNSPLGACPDCEGFGNVMDIDMDLVVPDPTKSIRDGAIAPWNTPAYQHELEELTGPGRRLPPAARRAFRSSSTSGTGS